jgi:hypothetical protein
MFQRWHDLLFAHWPMPFQEIRALVPRQLELESFGGRTWVGITPFRMSGVRFRGAPPVPGASSFPELNLRTYVDAGGKPGVYFFSLDARSLPAVLAARLLFGLPYFWSRMSCQKSGDRISYHCRRKGSASPPIEFSAEYEPEGKVFHSVPGSIEHWLTERYCLYTTSRGRIRRMDIEHAPWPLQSARARIERNSIAAAAGIRLPDEPPLLHFARRLDVLVRSPVEPRPLAGSLRSGARTSGSDLACLGITSRCFRDSLLELMDE